MKKNDLLLLLAFTGAAGMALASCSSDSGGGGGGGSAGYGNVSGTGGKGGIGGKGGTGGVGTGGVGTGGVGTGGVGTGGVGTGGVGTGGVGTGGSSTGGVAGSGTGGGDAGICKTPTTLHPPNLDAGTKNIYCPFSSPDGGKNQYCTSGSEHCCEPKSGTSTCEPLATSCPTGSTDWRCEDPVADCPSGQQCCGTGTLVKNTDPLCANYASGFTGTKCATSCTAGEITMCTSNAECPTGKTCLPFGAKGNQVGGCY